MKPSEKYTYRPTDTTMFFQKLNTVLYLCGFNDFWIDDVKLSAIFKKRYNFLSILIEIFMFLFMMLEVGSFFTQNNLSDKQATDRAMFGLTHAILYIYRLNFIYYKKEFREVIYQLAVGLKEVYNNGEVEIQMIKKLKLYLSAFVTTCALGILFYGASALIKYLTTGTTFTTVFTAWPDVHDQTDLANRIRVLSYCLWWIYSVRFSASYILVLSMLISLSCQYRNLQRYFTELNKVFEKPLGQPELETEFLSKFKVGIKLHSNTLWCQRECQKINSNIFGSQLLLTVNALVSMLQGWKMNSEHTLVNLAAFVTLACGTMLSTGFLMWNAGDVTVEASCLPACIFACGWQNCSRRAASRHLVAIAMMQAQKPVVFTAFGCVEMSYKTYLSIVKTSYSVFSLL